MLDKYKSIIIPLLEKLNELEKDRLGNRLYALDIQLVLLKKIITAEKFMRRLRSYLKDTKRQLGSKGNSKAKAIELKDRFKEISDLIEQQTFLIWVYRNIGDCIAFIYGERWDLKQYVFKEVAGSISGKVGLKLEVGILIKAYEAGGTVLMNDLTNTMRHADITIFRPDLWPDGGSPCYFIEAKSGNGGNKERAERQVKKIKEITSYLFDDKKEVEGGTYVRISPDEEALYHCEFITAMAHDLTPGSWLVRSPEPGLNYMMVDSDCPVEDLDKALPIAMSAGSKSMLISVNEGKQEDLAYYPYPLSFKDPETTFRFYNGTIVIYAIVDMQYVNERLKAFELFVDNTGPDEMPWEVKFIGDDDTFKDMKSFVGFYPIGRLGAEFISLEWLIRNCIAGEGLNILKEQHLKQSLLNPTEC